jgi:glycosyltransferase involved in cell wall biosynthesis
MITGKTPHHEAMARVAVKCFLAQSYTHKELVIINDGEYRLNIEHPAVREVHLNDDIPASFEWQRGMKVPLGRLRNIGLQYAKGEYVIQWDDDDFHHPHRILFQMAHMPRTDGPAAVLLRRQMRVSIVGKREAFNVEDTGGIAGTIIHTCGKSVEYPYDMSKGEDSHFLKCFGDNVVRVDNDSDIWPGPALYLRLYHGHNTWDEAHVMGGEDSFTGSWGMNADEREYLRMALAEYGKETPK